MNDQELFLIEKSSKIMNLTMRILEFCRFPLSNRFEFVMIDDVGQSDESIATNAINLFLTAIGYEISTYFCLQGHNPNQILF